MFTIACRLVLLGIALMAAGMTVAADSNGGMRVRSAGGDLVLVAGATGRTGQHVVSELLANGYKVRAFVRDIDEAREKLGDEIEYAAGDVRERETIDAALGGAVAIISAIGAGRGEPGNTPEFVDYGGVKNLAEAAVDARLSQFVLVSSGGVTHEDHVLNKMFDNVLIWKFKGEEAVRESGVPYTIVRPGGLVDKPSKEAAIVLEQGDEGTGMIPRADVAKVLVASLMFTEALNKTFEVVSGKGAAPGGWRSRFAALQPDE
jgi:uncharacterized protein YbjT (DUF2867 family)